MWKVSSPNGLLCLEIEKNSEGRLEYQVLLDEKMVIEKSVIGFGTSKEIDLRNALSWESEREIKEEYSLPAGKKEVYENHAVEKKLEFSVNGEKFIFAARVFDDGVAFRYGIDSGNVEEISIYSEKTEFNFSKQFEDMWLQTWVDTYEGPYELCEWEKTVDKHYGMPGLFHAKETEIWVMITEAGLWNTDGAYCSSHLLGKGDNRMVLDFAPEQTEPMKASLPAYTPWRVITVVKDLNTLVNSTINCSLNPPTVIRDTSWISPGRSIWSWWSFENGAQLFSEQKKYVDFAAALGFESITVDAGWDDTWVKDLCSYAKERNVTVWLWSDMQAVDTLEKAREKIPKWAEWGVVGLKVDFFMNDSQHTMWQYNMIADIMTENKLMINFHGSTKPAGECRTYPNLMTEEGIMGLEHYKWSDMPDARHNCTVPFTRNVIGSMDYTVTGISNGNRNTTQAHQLALSVVYESATQHFADSIYTYEEWEGTDFLRRTYGTYDEVRLLDGFPGEYVVIMRRKGSQWFIGGITQMERKIKISLDFLEEQMEMEIYQDAGNGLAKEKIAVDKNGEIQIDLQENGGFACYISKEIRPVEDGVHQGYMTRPWKKLYPAGDGSCEWEVDVPFCKRQTLRICYESESEIQIKVGINGKMVYTDAEASGPKGTKRVTDVTVELEKGKNLIRVEENNETIIHTVSIIDWAMPEESWYDAGDCVLNGGARLEKVPGKEDLNIQGIGENGTAEFAGINIEQSGEYILLLDYYSGENRYLQVGVNDEPLITTVLFNSSGWGPSRWDVIGRKEVKIFLNQGTNIICLRGKEAGPHIGRIGIRLEKAVF